MVKFFKTRNGYNVLIDGVLCARIDKDGCRFEGCSLGIVKSLSEQDMKKIEAKEKEARNSFEKKVKKLDRKRNK